MGGIREEKVSGRAEGGLVGTSIGCASSRLYGNSKAARFSKVGRMNDDNELGHRYGSAGSRMK